MSSNSPDPPILPERTPCRRGRRTPGGRRSTAGGMRGMRRRSSAPPPPLPPRRSPPRGCRPGRPGAPCCAPCSCAGAVAGSGSTGSTPCTAPSRSHRPRAPYTGHTRALVQGLCAEVRGHMDYCAAQPEVRCGGGGEVSVQFTTISHLVVAYLHSRSLAHALNIGIRL